jgi:hypothetical protein
MKHIQDLWRIEEDSTTGLYIIIKQNNISLYDAHYGELVRYTKEDAQRIVDCVNAMQDVYNPEWFVQRVKDMLDNKRSGIEIKIVMEELREALFPQDNSKQEVEDAT